MTDEQADLISLKQMAKLLGCTPKTFSKQVRKDGVPFIRVGHRMHFDPATVKAYLSGRIADEQKVVQFKPVKRLVKKSKFAEALGL